MSAVPIRTDRLLLRPWRDDDRAPFAALNADPEVMEHFPSTLTRDESDLFADSVAAHLDEQGWGTYAVEVIDGPEFIGYIGLAAPEWLGATEVRWRLLRDQWGHGYATEGARAALADGFERLGLDEIVAITVPANDRSRAVMRKLGMTHDPADDFDHPYLPGGHPLRRHVKYRLRREAVHPGAAAQRRLAEAGFADFGGPRLAIAFLWIAEALAQVTLDDFTVVNEWVGTKHGIAGGWVLQRVEELESRGYLTFVCGEGLRLTPRGRAAARALGVASTGLPDGRDHTQGMP